MKLAYHSFIAQKRNAMFWVNLLFVLFLSAGIISLSVFHQDIDIYWVMWVWFWTIPMESYGKRGEGIYYYLPLDLQDKKKIYLNYIFVMWFVLGFAQLLLYLFVLYINTDAIYMLSSTKGWLLSVILFLNICEFMLTKCRSDCISVSKRFNNIGILCVILCIVLILFPNYKIGVNMGYWIFVGIYFLTAVIFIVLIWVSYVDYIPKNSLDEYSKEKKV